MALDTADMDALKGEFKSLLDERDKKSDDLGEQIDHLKTKSEEDATDIKGRIDGTNEEIKGINEALDTIEKKLAKQRSFEERKTIGQQFIESDAFKAANLTEQGRVSVEVKDILNSGNIATGVSRNVLVPEQESGFVAPPQIELQIRNLFLQGTTTSNAIRSIRETGYTNNAAPVAEGAVKPLSDLTFGEVTLPVQKIAHRFKASMEALDDAPMLRSYIDGRGRYGLNLVEEAQLLTGDGTGGNLSGVLPQATAYDNTTLAGYTPTTMVDDIRVAKLQVRKALYPASGIVMSPDSWAEIELLKDGDNHYLFSSVTTGATPTLWGMPVVTSDSMDPGDFLIGAFGLAAQIWDRMGMTVLMSTEDEDNFQRNLMTILFEKRLALEVTRPEAFVYHNEVV